jgi:hypothetical protein
MESGNTNLISFTRLQMVGPFWCHTAYNLVLIDKNDAVLTKIPILFPSSRYFFIPLLDKKFRKMFFRIFFSVNFTEIYTKKNL